MRQQLDKIFNPQSIAAIGASVRTESIGYPLIENLIDGGFRGKIFPINLKYKEVHGYKCYQRIADLPQKVDLAVICTPPYTVLDLVEECGRTGVGGIVLLTSGFEGTASARKAHYAKILKRAQKYSIRIIGPNCLGVMTPGIGLNASFASKMVLPGNIAFISQSGALCTSILDWSVVQNVGFSHFVSLGSMLDIGFEHLIDYFGTDARTTCILMYMESLHDARRFMSAARAFARHKPIIVLKAGKSAEGGEAAHSHSGSLAGNDGVFEAAFRRAGIIRVDTVAQLFHCAQAMAMQPRPIGNRLAIITNAGGPGVLATDHLIANGGTLAKFSSATLKKLDEVLPKTLSKTNPIDLKGNATPEDYEHVIKACFLDEQVDGLLVILSPDTRSKPKEVARMLTQLSKKYKKTVLASWMGEHDVWKGREILEAGKIPNYRYPESAVDVFLKMHEHRRILKLLYETPPANPLAFTPDRERARQLIEKALGEGRMQLSEDEAKQLMSCYNIMAGSYKVVNNTQDAIAFAAEIGYPVVLKIASPDITHKTEVNGVRLNIHSAQEVQDTFIDLISTTRRLRPDARILGVIIEKMTTRRFELLIGAKTDPDFGPVVLFGKGGTAVEVYRDFQMGLPPLNMALAKQIIRHTRIYPLLEGYRGMPGVNLDYLAALLCNFAYLLMDFPEVQTIDINPFVMDENYGIALDAHIVLQAVPDIQKQKFYHHLVIMPYPAQYSKQIFMKNGQPVLLRPIRPEDEPMEAAMLVHVSRQSLYYRFFGYVPSIDHQFLSRFTHIDYEREMAIIAEIEEDGIKKMVGVVRIIADAWGEGAEYAIVIADPWQGQGLGGQMTDYILEVARAMGLKYIYASVLSSNEGMIALFKSRGFSMNREEFDVYNVHLEL